MRLAVARCPCVGSQSSDTWTSLIRRRRRAASITNEATGATLATDVRVAADPWTRLIGLMGRRALAPGTALVFPGTRQIHTHFMRVPIDVVFYTADGTILHVLHTLRPWSLSPRVPDAAGVVELPAGTLASNSARFGDRLRIC